MSQSTHSQVQAEPARHDRSRGVASSERSAARGRSFGSDPTGLMQLQRSAGNRAVQQLVAAGGNGALPPRGQGRSPAAGPARVLQRKCACGAPAASAKEECAGCAGGKTVQAKLAVGHADDPLEAEADRVADRVLGTAAPGAVQAAPVRVQRLAAGASPAASSAPASVDRVLASAGNRIDEGVRADMEQRFGHDFSRVRIHTSAAAERSARDIEARAYTVGHDVVFGAGMYAPHTHAGRLLLAHELVHVVQQGSAQPLEAGRRSVAAPARTPIAVARAPIRVMRSPVLDSTIQICRRVLESREIRVSKGGLRVVLALSPVDQGVPDCKDHDFWITLTRSVDLWPDDEIATCGVRTGGARSVSFGKLSSGTYYLTIHRVFDHPYCCIEGGILAFDEAIQADSTGCVKDEDPSALDIIHGALDIAGFIPVLGAIPDGINAGIYAIEGDWVNAGLSAVAMVPAWGDGVKLGAIAGKSAIKVSEKAAFRLGEEGIAKGLKEVKAASKVEKAAMEGADDLAGLAKVEKEAAQEGAAKGAQQAEKELADNILKAFRRGRKIKSVGAVSLKRLRQVLGHAGAKPGEYKLVKATKKELEALGDEANSVFGWVARNGAGEVVRDPRGRPIITFTAKGLASLEEAVKTFGHEVKHLKDFAAGVRTSSEALAEEAGEKLWLVVEAMLKQ
jgi:hypothetical protein